MRIRTSAGGATTPLQRDDFCGWIKASRDASVRVHSRAMPIGQSAFRRWDLIASRGSGGHSLRICKGGSETTGKQFVPWAVETRTPHALAATERTLVLWLSRRIAGHAIHSTP